MRKALYVLPLAILLPLCASCKDPVYNGNNAGPRTAKVEQPSPASQPQSAPMATPAPPIPSPSDEVAMLEPNEKMKAQRSVVRPEARRSMARESDRGGSEGGESATYSELPTPQANSRPTPTSSTSGVSEVEEAEASAESPESQANSRAQEIAQANSRKKESEQEVGEYTSQSAPMESAGRRGRRRPASKAASSVGAMSGASRVRARHERLLYSRRRRAAHERRMFRNSPRRFRSRSRGL